MIPVKSPLGRAHVYLILFTELAFAALQNITIDDAVLNGTVIPQYLPSASSWNIGNNCSRCLVQPDPSLAYNGTWHDATYQPNSRVSQTIEFIFTGSAIYIFFIIANAVQDATTLTDVNFYLDTTLVDSYVHSPSTDPDYQYNVPVYVNESLTFGEHSVLIEPAKTGNPVLMLFDYLVYTTQTDSSASTTSISTPSSMSVSPSSSPSPTSPEIHAASAQRTAAIVGGTVGGIAAFVLVAASLLFCWRYKRRNDDWFYSAKKGSVVSLFSLQEATPIPFDGTSSSNHRMEYSFTESSSPGVRSMLVTMRPPSPPVSVDPPSNASVLGNNTGLTEQVEMLRQEVLRLRYLQDQRQNSFALGSGPT